MPRKTSGQEHLQPQPADCTFSSDEVTRQYIEYLEQQVAERTAALHERQQLIEQIANTSLQS